MNHEFDFNDLVVPNASADQTSHEDDDAESCTTSSRFSQTTDPDDVLLEALEAELNTLTLEAQTIISHQPRATQLKLTSETRTLFNSYKQHGSMARLKVGVEKFLRSDNDGGTLHFADLEVEKENPDPGHYGEAFMINHTEDDDVPKFVDQQISVTNSPNGRTSRYHQLRIIDQESVSYVTTLPFDPVGMVLSWPGSLDWPRGLLSRINQLFSLVDFEARVRLFHHVSKYGPSPVFRVGIAEHVQSQYGTIFQAEEDHYLGLTPETRSFLKDVFAVKPLLNRAERRMIARICRVAEESVAIFWDDTNEERSGYKAMRTFVVAREVERAKDARRARGGEDQSDGQR